MSAYTNEPVVFTGELDAAAEAVYEEVDLQFGSTLTLRQKLDIAEIAADAYRRHLLASERAAADTFVGSAGD
jgi:hypothetical protein